MKGIADKMKPSEAAMASLRSGADLVMLSWSRKDQQDVYESLQKSLQTGEFPMADFNKKLDRLRKVKSLIGLAKAPSVTAVDWNSHEIRLLNRELLLRNLARDRASYRKIDPSKTIYVYNLNTLWSWQLSRKFGSQKVIPVENPQQFLQMKESQKSESLLLLGLQRRDHLKVLNSLSVSDKGRVILILMNDLKIENPTNYFSVFKPLWPFEDMAQSVIQYL
jgi:beta-glucosidase-like glycosyl hydrolase